MKGVRLPITQLKTDTRVTKKMRIRSMVPYFKAGLFIIPCDGGLDSLTGNMAIMVDELTRFPRTANDDCIDALAYMNQLTKRPGVIHILSKIPSGSFMAIKAKLRKPKGILGSMNVRRIHAH
jgi:phage terminase large subunit-like protein